MVQQYFSWWSMPQCFVSFIPLLRNEFIRSIFHSRFQHFHGMYYTWICFHFNSTTQTNWPSGYNMIPKEVHAFGVRDGCLMAAIKHREGRFCFHIRNSATSFCRSSLKLSQKSIPCQRNCVSICNFSLEKVLPLQVQQTFYSRCIHRNANLTFSWNS